MFVIKKLVPKAFLSQQGKKNRSAKAFVLDKKTTILLLITQLLHFVGLAQELSWWMLTIILACLLWQVLIIVKNLAKPAKWLLSLLSFAGCTLLIISAKQLGLLSTMVHLLCFAYVLKVFELKRRADFYQLMLLSLFVASSALIFAQSLSFSVYIMLLVLANLMVLLCYFSPGEKLLTIAKLSAKLILYSVPLALVLFIVFPKLAPLWQVPFAQSAKSGLSDSVSAGDIANLALSDELAFTVSFANTVPKYSQMYWRTLVLEQYDGKSWKLKAKGKKSAEQQRFNLRRLSRTAQTQSIKINANGEAVNYQVIAQPSYQNWLYALAVTDVDRSAANGASIIIKEDHTLYNQKNISQTFHYRAASYLDAPLSVTLTAQQRQANVDYPQWANPRLVAEAKRLRKLHAQDGQLITALLKKFNQDNFHYTLRPPLLTDNSLDQFYFETQAGFCEHYASTFTFLMRAANIPARMVTGYLGAEYNHNANYYSVYQRDAHAWSEVWLEGHGWVRIDPTAAINPERIERGFSPSLLQELSTYSGNYFSLMRYKRFPWVNNIRLQLQAIDYQWTLWVIGYSGQKQRQVLSQLLAIISSWPVIFSVLVLLSLGILWFLWLNRVKKVTKNHAIFQQYYQQALQLLTDQGLVKAKDMTAAEFSSVVTQQLPKIAVCFSQLTQLYLMISYQPLSVTEQAAKTTIMQKLLQQLKRQLRR